MLKFLSVKKLFSKTFILFACALGLFCCKTKELPEDAVLDLRNPETPSIESQAGDLMARADYILMRSNYLVELYVQDSTSNVLRKVENFDTIPPRLAAVYNVIRNQNGDIFYVAEFPYSPTGEFENIYESVFDDAGNLLLFVRKSTFDIVYEKSQYFYNEKHDLVKKTYLLSDIEDKEIPSQLKINFKYRLPYEKYKTRKEWLKAHGLEK
jgi:hypothetical protein